MKAISPTAMAIIAPLLLAGACSGVDISASEPTLAAEGPCPGSIGKDEAIRLAKRFAEDQSRNYQEHPVRAGWSGAYWSVTLGVDGEGENKIAFVDVAADSKVIGCETNLEGRACGPERSYPKGSCLPADGSVPSAQEALGIAAQHLRSYGVAVNGSYQDADWYGANWWVLLLPDPLYVDGHFTVHVSPDGSEYDVSGAFSMYSEHGFVRRRPGDDTRPISSGEAIERARGWLRERNIEWQEEKIETSWMADHWYVTFVGGAPGPEGDIGVTVAWDGKVTDHIRYQGPDPAVGSCPDTDKFR